MKIDDCRSAGHEWEDDWAETDVNLPSEAWIQYQRFAQDEIEGLIFVGGYLMHPIGIEKAKEL